MATAEAATPTTTRKTQDKKVFPSPLALYVRKFCHRCDNAEWCKPNDLRMMICVLCAILNTHQHRGARL